MKIFLFILLAIIILISWGLTTITQPLIGLKSKNSKIPASKDRLYKDVETLTDMPSRNYQNPHILNATADYIATEFEKLTCEVSRQKYQAAVSGGEEATYQNVIATFGKEHKERIVIGAHYDVCGIQPGADDNASAVAGLLEVARLLDELKPDLKYRIDFVAYTLEEPPFYNSEFMGSYVHAKSLHDQGVKLKMMLCLEMIGYFSEKKNSQHYPISIMKWFYPNKANFIAVIGKRGQGEHIKKVKRSMAEVADINVRSIQAPESLVGIDFSDHRSYWHFGYDAVMINNTAFYRNPNYHEPTDRIETLDFDKMTEVVRGAYWALVNL